MRKMKRSLGYAVEGVHHAFTYEQNVRLFLYGYIVVVAAGLYCDLLSWEWITLFIAGGIFFAIELCNTSLERLTDVIDENRKIAGGAQFHAGLKQAKDVAAGASLICLLMNALVIVIVFWPYVVLMIKGR